MKKVMFVCHGNICRSPMAEFVMKDLVKKVDREKEFLIDSSATSTEEIGNGIYPPAKRKLIEKGVPFTEHYARQIKKAEYDDWDLFICMDGANVRNLMRIFENDKKNKVKKLLDYTGHGGDVADPWYTGNFENTYLDVLEGCKKLLEIL
ncbi:MAG: low molecular weight phosphotyrosine protein phosphatase [Clostridia bacterium]|nr:low molecular weight phosphotyrosine protein phosphatase [Clostridia bacterium]